MKQKKIAILFAANINNKKGLFNAVHNRVLHLSKIANFQIDVFLISSFKPKFLTWIMKDKIQQERPNTIYIDNIKYNILWYQSSLIDYILKKIFKINPIVKNHKFRQFAKGLNDYDLIESHSGTNEIAEYINYYYRTPFCITWHGSDIHSEPFKDKASRLNVIRQMESAQYNFFVSHALLKCSDRLTINARKVILYNGADIIFHKYQESEKYRINLNPTKQKIIAFAGNLIPIKNISSLSKIFNHIFQQDNNTLFWILGDGPLKEQLRKDTKNIPIRFWGNVEKSKMPDFLNFIDVLVLPSLNEGLPLITIEAISCGCKVVGSDVGGISEVIGKNNCVALNDNQFEKKIANRVLYLLNNKSKEQQNLDSKFNWNLTAQKELNIISKILNNENSNSTI